MYFHVSFVEAYRGFLLVPRTIDYIFMWLVMLKFEFLHFFFSFCSRMSGRKHSAETSREHARAYRQTHEQFWKMSVGLGLALCVFLV